MKKTIPLFTFTFILHLGLLAATTNSNSVLVKAWYRDSVHFDTVTGEFSSTNIPSAAEAEAMDITAGEITNLYAAAIASMQTNLAPLRARIDEQRRRPVVNILMSAGPNAALDRRNLTFRIMSNELSRIEGGYHIDAWVFGNTILRSNPLMESDFSNLDRTVTNAVKWTWDNYGTNSVTITDHGEDYECFKMSTEFQTAATNLSIYINPWITIARPGKMFNFGNRRSRTNGVFNCTTNDLSFLGRFYTTNGVEILTHKPYGDNGYLFWAERETE